MKQEITRIIEGHDGFGLGDLWRPSNESLSALLPILRTNHRERLYTTFPEAAKAGSVKITDEGVISPVLVHNKGELPVLLRAGDIISGPTQERTFTKTRVVDAGEKVGVEVVCVHASRGIVAGAAFTTPDVITPYNVRSHFYDSEGGKGSSMGSGGLQSETWARATLHSAENVIPAAAASGPSAVMDSSLRMDDVTQAQQTYREQLKDILKDMPIQEDQVGVAVLDPEGCKSLETFDVQASFKAMQESVLGQSEAVGRKMKDLDSVFEYKPENAPTAIRRIMLDIFEVECVWSSKDGKTDYFSGRTYVGESTYFRGEMIHLLALRK